MSASARVVPAHLGFLAIYNPSLGTTDETIENQIVYYSTPGLQERKPRRSTSDQKPADDAAREENNEQLRQIGLAQGMVEFGRSFSDGKAVDTVETEKSRIVLHELESGWWILASINLTVLPGGSKSVAGKDKAAEQSDTMEYSSREVKPAILLLGDLLRAHSIFLLHHASSLSALFVRTRRPKFMGILGRYWDTFLTTWNVLMHGNPSVSLYGGIKVAACGELGMGVGEEERGSGEREVLEGLVGRIEGLVDVVVSKFGEANSDEAEDTSWRKISPKKQPTEPWLGVGNEPSVEDGAVFLGNGAISRKSLRDISHWIEDLYRWGPYAYGVIDNPSSNRPVKKFKQKSAIRKTSLSPETKKKPKHAYGLSLRDKPRRQSPLRQESMVAMPPIPVNDSENRPNSPTKKRRPSLRRAPSSTATVGSDDASKGSKFVQYLKLGYGTHWSLGGSSGSTEEAPESSTQDSTGESGDPQAAKQGRQTSDGTFETSLYAQNFTNGHFLIGLLGDIENEDEDADVNVEDLKYSGNDSNDRLLLRTLTLELERDEDAREESEITLDLSKDSSSKVTGSEHTGTSNASYESQDHNKTKKLRVVVYVNKPFMFVFLFELRTDALALPSLYRSLHYQIAPLLKPLLLSTAFRASRPDVTATDESTTPIYDLVWDPRTLTINSTIPNIPDPVSTQSPQASATWSRIEALNTHVQIINTYIAISPDRSELERTCKTSRGWWVVWTRILDTEPHDLSLASGHVKVPEPITEEGQDIQNNQASQKLSAKSKGTSRGTSTMGASTISGAAHPYLEAVKLDFAPKDKEIFLIRRASDHAAARSASRFVGGSSAAASDASWISGPGKLAQGIGVDTKRYIEGLLNLNR